jgi:hydroxypyruvate isomerase
MPKFAANLSMMYNEVPFMERFGSAARDGFKAVEFLFPYAFEAGAIAGELQRHGLQQVLFNTVPGDFDAGERGLAAIPGREGEFLDGVDRALVYAEALRCERIHAMAGLMAAGADRARWRATYVGNLREAARRCAARGVTLLIEPINTRDIPGFFLNTQADAHAIVAEVGAPNLKVQMDLYHCQIVEGDLAKKLERYLPTGAVGHLQMAGVPERHEPDVGEVNHRYLFDLVDRLGWRGWIGCEYRPRLAAPGGTSAGLGWFQPYRTRTP